MTKNCPSCFISQEPYIIWMSFMVHLCKMIISPGVFFIFFKIMIFSVVRRVKGQKMNQNDKKFYPSCLISQEPCIIWMSFMVHLCKMIISRGVFFIFFKIMIFWVIRWVKGQKMNQNDKKILSVMLDISGTIHHMIVIYGTHVQNDNISMCFLHFLKFWFFWLLGG